MSYERSEQLKPSVLGDRCHVNDVGDSLEQLLRLVFGELQSDLRPEPCTVTA